MGDDNSFQTGTASGVDGKYITSKLPNGKYRVTFRNIGYKEKIEIINDDKGNVGIVVDENQNDSY